MLRFELEVLSPVHIGSGERITDWEYVIEENTIKVYPYDYLIGQLVEKNPSFLASLKTLMQRQDYNLRRLFSEGLRVEKPLYELELRKKPETREVELFIKSLGKPYVPGSEIKGALRTAFIGGLLLEDRGLREHVEKILKERAQKKGRGFEELLLYPEGKSKPSYDLFKWLSVPDLPCGLEDLCVEVPRLVGSSRRLYACEALKEGTKLMGNLCIDKVRMDVAHSVEKLKYRIFDAKPFSISDIDWNLLQELSQSFYGLVIELEMEFFKNKNMSEICTHLQKVKERSKEGILLRIGKHQGYLSTTIMAVYKKTNPELFNLVYENSVYKVHQERPGTRKVSSQGFTFGWVLLKKL